jgi:hypothetical protein
MLHLTNGDSAADSMREAGLPGEVIVWPDVLHEGPAPAEHGPAWRETRARFLSARQYCPFEDAMRSFERADTALSRYPHHDELVLWFEHDLFDQLLLARHLHWLTTAGPAPTHLSLICIDAFPGVEPFYGLGQLTATQLASLFPSRRPIAREQVSAGADVWRAFTSDDPRGLAVVARHGVPELPFMAGAIQRLLEEFPGPDGLSRTERTVLREIRHAPRSARDLFLAFQRQEERVFMGDLTFLRTLEDLASGSAPLARLSHEDSRHVRRDAEEVTMVFIALAPAGLRVLDGEDAIALRGIDRWIGGVHLTTETTWRWNGHDMVLTGLT